MVLKESATLQGRYVIQRVLGEAGPIDITYLARDEQQEKDVVIREYFPTAVAKRGADGVCEPVEAESFAYGKAEYELEGNTLTHLSHSHIVPSINQFKENGTVYRVSDHVMGISLRAYIRQKGGKVSEEDALERIKPIMQGLEAGHQLGLIHGSRSNTSVFFDQGKTPVLFNFQAARLFTAQLTGNVKDVRIRGFSPPEIRMERDQLGPWSDVYSVGALLYFMISGRMLPTVIYPSHFERLRKAIDRVEEISSELKDVLLRAMAMDYEERPQTIAALRGMLVGTLVPDQEQMEEIGAGTALEMGGDGGAENGLMNWDETDETAPEEITIYARKNGLSMEEFGSEQKMPSAAVPSLRDEHLPAQKINNDEDLQARLSKLESRQKGLSNIIITALLMVLTAAATLFFGSDIINKSSPSSSAVQAEPVGISPLQASANSESLTNNPTSADNEEVASSSALSPQKNGGEGMVTDSSGIKLNAVPLEAKETPPAGISSETPTLATVQPASTRVKQAASDRAQVRRQAIAQENERQYQYLRGQGDVLFDQGQWKEALNVYTSALEFRPGDAYLARQLTIARDSTERINKIAEIAFEKERQYQYFRGQGDVLFQEKRWEEALGAYNSALEFQSGDEYLMGRMGLARDSMNAAAQAAQQKSQLEELIARVTDDSGIFVVPDTPVRLMDEGALRAKVKYPSRARRAGVEGRVIIRMIVDEEGHMQNPVVVEGIGFGCDEEVIEVLRGARFASATFRDAPVKAWYMFSLVFSLQ